MTERIVLEPRLQCREPKAFWIVQTFGLLAYALINCEHFVGGEYFFSKAT